MIGGLSTITYMIGGLSAITYMTGGLSATDAALVTAICAGSTGLCHRTATCRR